MNKLIIGVLTIVALIGLSTGKANATGFHLGWSAWNYDGRWSACHTEATCGVAEGTRERGKTRYCILKLGGGQNECNYLGQTQTGWQTEACTVELPACIEPEPEPTPEPTPETTPSARPKFSSDDRCVYSKPADATWVSYSTPASCDNPRCVELLWSLEGADKVEVKFGDDASGDYLKWGFVTSNDGHQVIENLSNMNHWFSIRGINHCAKGNWSEPIDP